MKVEIIDGNFIHSMDEWEERNYVWNKFLRYWPDWSWDERTFALRNYPQYIDWDWVFKQYILPEHMLREFKDYINWNIVISQLHVDIFSKEFIKELIDNFDEYNIKVTFLDEDAVKERLNEILKTK